MKSYRRVGVIRWVVYALVVTLIILSFGVQPSQEQWRSSNYLINFGLLFGLSTVLITLCWWVLSIRHRRTMIAEGSVLDELVGRLLREVTRMVAIVAYLWFQTSLLVILDGRGLQSTTRLLILVVPMVFGLCSLLWLNLVCPNLQSIPGSVLAAIVFEWGKQQLGAAKARGAHPAPQSRRLGPRDKAHPYKRAEGSPRPDQVV